MGALLYKVACILFGKGKCPRCSSLDTRGDVDFKDGKPIAEYLFCMDCNYEWDKKELKTEEYTIIE